MRPTLPEVPLPFADEAGEDTHVEDLKIVVPRVVPKIKITANRIYTFGPTDGCEACISNMGASATLGLGYKKHTDACKRRFLSLLESNNGHTEFVSELADRHSECQPVELGVSSLGGEGFPAMSSRDGGEPVPTDPRDPDIPTVFGASAVAP